MRKIITVLTAMLLVALLATVAFAQDGSLQEKVNVAEANGTLVLEQDEKGSVTVTKNLTLDLNGFDITGTLTAADGVTVWVKDSKTDDYTVADEDYGKIAAISGNVVAADGYLAITETVGTETVGTETETSYHKLVLKVKNATLRAGDSGMYYTCEFAGDEVIKRNINGYGVALSVNAPATGADIAADTDEKKHVEYTADTWATGAANSANGVLLYGIMKTENGYIINKRNASVDVYGVAYIRMGQQYLLCQEYSLKFRDAVEYADTKWDSLEQEQKDGLLKLHDQFGKVMATWAVENLDAAAQEIYEKRELKILCIGNSFSRDSMWILEKIAKAEGTEHITLGILYYSGCPLSKHAEFLTSGEAAYSYDKNANGSWVVSGNGTATFLDGVTDEDWDIVVMQQSSSSSGRTATYNEDIQTIIDCVLENDKNPATKPQFAWNMTWAYPVEDVDTDDIVTVNTTSAFSNYYNNDQMTMYNCIVEAVEKKIVPNPVFEFIMPVGTAIQNARSSYLGDPDLNRDYSHLSDLGRVIAGYTWYSILTGKEITEISLNEVPKGLRALSVDKSSALELTDELKAIILESVQNAVKKPFAVTQSQYTEKP